MSSQSLSTLSIPRVSLRAQIQTNDEIEKNNTWEQLRTLEVPVRQSHTGQTLRALLKVRGLNMLRDPMAVFFQVFMPVAFAALGIWLGTLSTERKVEPKQQFTFGKKKKN